MVKNSRGGNKAKNKARKNCRPIRSKKLDELLKSMDQEYAYVNKKYGDGRYDLMCYDKVKRMGIMRGRLKRRYRLDQGQLVLVGLRDFQDNKCDIIEVYSPEDIQKLIKSHEVTLSFTKEGKLLENCVFTNNESSEDSYNETSDDDIKSKRTTKINIDDI